MNSESGGGPPAQYTDTLEWLREQLKGTYGPQIACYTGGGGSRWNGARRVDVERDVLVGVVALEVEQLCHDQVGDGVVDRGPGR